MDKQTHSARAKDTGGHIQCDSVEVLAPIKALDVSDVHLHTLTHSVTLHSSQST